MTKKLLAKINSPQRHGVTENSKDRLTIGSRDGKMAL